MAATATAKSTAPARRAQTRRASGRTAPARKPAAGRAAPRPRRRSGQTPIAGFVPVAAAAGAVGGIADSGLVVRLTRSRLWIGLLGGLLVGIVALNVIALSFSASSSNAARQADELKRQNSILRSQIVQRLSSEEVAAAASRLGLITPAPEAVRYLRPVSGDAAEAARRLRSGELGASYYVPAETPPVIAAETVPAETAVDPAEVAPEVVAPETVAPETAAQAPPAAPPATATAPAGGGVSSP